VKAAKRKSPALKLAKLEARFEERTRSEEKRWRKVEAPRGWYPKNLGETIEGKYLGRTIRNGQYGQYEVALIKTKTQTYMISGVKIIQLLDAANLESGDMVRIIWGGTLHTGTEGNAMKMFELYVEVT